MIRYDIDLIWFDLIPYYSIWFESFNFNFIFVVPYSFRCNRGNPSWGSRRHRFRRGSDRHRPHSQLLGMKGSGNPVAGNTYNLCRCRSLLPQHEHHCCYSRRPVATEIVMIALSPVASWLLVGVGALRIQSRLLILQYILFYPFLILLPEVMFLSFGSSYRCILYGGEWYSCSRWCWCWCWCLRSG